MLPKVMYLRCPYALEDIRVQNDTLNSKVLKQVNDTQELVMLNNFAHESNKYQLKKCIEDRIADISSWRWVLEDLAKRLKDAIGTLCYEHNAIKVVIGRLQDELQNQSNNGNKPLVLNVWTDSVEDAILEEHQFLRDEKKKFEKLLIELDTQIGTITKVKNRIEADILNKEQALSIEEACANITSAGGRQYSRKRRKRGPLLVRWENRCLALKRSGLNALRNTIIIRQQVRGARIHLSIAAQAYAARADSALRRRLHSNKVKLQDLQWQKEEALRDHQSLAEELTTTEQNLLENMEQERLIEARLADRRLRPASEMTRDQVDKKLREELARLRSFSKQMRTNHERITALQNSLTDSISRTDCYADDIMQIVRLDENRIQARLGEDLTGPPNPVPASNVSEDGIREMTPSRNTESLEVIREEEEDDYPFPY